MSETLSSDEQRILLDLAREAITSAVRGEQIPEADLNQMPARLCQKGASFVTLLEPDGQLRGCIGSVEAHAPLAHDVQRNAVGSAMRDPRFLPVGIDEVDRLRIELSVLTEPRLLAFDGPDDLLDKIRPDVDGVIIQKDWRRATLLPSVWAKIPGLP